MIKRHYFYHVRCTKDDGIGYSSATGVWLIKSFFPRPVKLYEDVRKDWEANLAAHGIEGHVEVISLNRI